MEKFIKLKSIPAHIPLMNIDTDMIIPKQFLKTIKRTGLGKSLFYEMRYDESGKLINKFILNNDCYSKIMMCIKTMILYIKLILCSIRFMLHFHFVKGPLRPVKARCGCRHAECR